MDPAPVLIVAHHSTHHLAHRCRDTHPRRPSLSPKYLTRAQMPSQITTVLLRRRPTRMRIVARRGAARFFVSGRELRLVVSTAGWLDGHTRVHEYRVSHDEIDHGGRSRRHSDSTLIPKEGKWLLLLRRLRPRRLSLRRLRPRRLLLRRLRLRRLRLRRLSLRRLRPRRLSLRRLRPRSSYFWLVRPLADYGLMEGASAPSINLCRHAR